jgi:hypothetical protein
MLPTLRGGRDRRQDACLRKQDVFEQSTRLSVCLKSLKTLTLTRLAFGHAKIPFSRNTVAVPFNFQVASTLRATHQKLQAIHAGPCKSRFLYSTEAALRTVDKLQELVRRSLLIMARGPKKAKGGKGRGPADDPAFHKGHKPFSIARVSAPKIDARAGKVARWDAEDDIPEDEEDAFHRQRDVVLLNGGRGVGGGRVDEEDGE